jgi:hypothetical protein
VFNFLLSPDVVIFTGAFALVVMLGLVEVVGLGLGGMDVDFDGDGVLSWLGVGQVPLLVLLVAFLSIFALAGLAGQQIAASFWDGTISALYAVPAAAILALPLTRGASSALARVMPHDETTAIDPTDLVGRIATLTTGRATKGSPARAQVRDQFGQAHNIMVEPDNDGEIFEEGDTILLVRRETGAFRAILHERPRYQEWIEA